MSLAAELQRDWRQFRLLSRDSIRRLLDHVVISREADPAQFAIWGTALALCPPLLFSVRKIVAPPERFEAMLTADRLFFLVYGMLAAALLAALTWEALYPDRTDQEIVGVLPVKPSTLAAARLSAAVAVSVVFTGAINLPTGVVYSIASAAHPIVGALPRLLAGHLVATTLGCTFVFLALVLLRGVVAIVAGERVANRLAVVLQIVTIVALVEVFLFLPSVLPALLRQMQAAGSAAGTASLLPPLWFAALFAWIADGRGLLVAQAGTAVAAVGAVLVLTAIVSLGPAAWMGRRALLVRSTDRASLLMIVARAVAVLFARRPAVRGMFLFGVASLSRSRRHALYLASYLGMAIAAAILGLIAAELRGRLQFAQPTHYLLVLPLVFMFFAVFGLRGALAVPTDVDANWPFRMSPPTVGLAVQATRLLIMTFGIVPIVAVWLSVTLAVWPPGVAHRAGVAQPHRRRLANGSGATRLGEGAVRDRARTGARDAQVAPALVHLLPDALLPRRCHAAAVVRGSDRRHDPASRLRHGRHRRYAHLATAPAAPAATEVRCRLAGPRDPEPV